MWFFFSTKYGNSLINLTPNWINHFLSKKKLTIRPGTLNLVSSDRATFAATIIHYHSNYDSLCAIGNIRLRMRHCTSPICEQCTGSLRICPICFCLYKAVDVRRQDINTPETSVIQQVPLDSNRYKTEVTSFQDIQEVSDMSALRTVSWKFDTFVFLENCLCGLWEIEVKLGIFWWCCIITSTIFHIGDLRFRFPCAQFGFSVDYY